MDSAWIGQYIRKQSFHSDSWTWQLCLGVKSNCTANNALVDDSIPHLGLFTHWNFSLLSAFSSIINRIILMIGAWPSIAAKSLQSCPTLCDPIDVSPWGSPVPGILQARIPTGVGCHFLLQCRKVKSQSEVAQSCPTLSDPMDCSLPGSSAHGIFQAKILEWGAIAFSVTFYCRMTNASVLPLVLPGLKAKR